MKFTFWYILIKKIQLLKKILILKINQLIFLLWSFKKTVIISSLFLVGGCLGGYYYFYIYIPRILEMVANEQQMIRANAALQQLALVNNINLNLNNLNFLEPFPMGFLDAMFFLFNKVVALAEAAPNNVFVDFMIERHPENIRFDVLNRPYFIIDAKVLVDFENQVASSSISSNVDLQELVAEIDPKNYGAIQASLDHVMRAIEINNRNFRIQVEVFMRNGFSVLALSGAISALILVSTVVIQNM